ncbi:hypothetical protein YYC_02196 [Plasmodium yoelii 17X]|uniref:YIR protein n=1 Tax=Plasmodium yoelii 17X TaxID=1323249 RepID=V7PP50_PLAYE|nr:hypothetical protein YYC_02196 [Plasmodium yoelii 17X]
MTLYVCEAFKNIDDYWVNNFSFEKNDIYTGTQNTYYHTNTETQNGKYETNSQTVSDVTVLLLNKLFTENKYLESENKNNEYITYIMLWLSNKMKLIKTRNYESVADFYAEFMSDGEKYKTYINQINKNQKIMNLKIDRTRILYGLLNDLCNAIIKYKKDSSNCLNLSKCPDFLNFVNNWEKESKYLIKKKHKVFEDEHYCDVLLTLKSAYEKYKQDNNMKSKLPEIEEIEEIYDCKKLSKAKNSSKVKSGMPKDVSNGKNNLENGKDISRYIDIVKSAFETYSSNFSIMFTSIGNNLYENMLPPLTNLYGKIINFAEKTINHVNEEFRKSIEPSISDKGMLEPQALRNEPSSSQDPGTKVTGHGITEIGDNPLNVYKKMGISILILLISIALAIMYKYVPFGWRKKSKKKKKMKKAINMLDTNETTEKVINPTDRKKQMQLIINLSTQKKQDKKFINLSTQKKQDKKITNSSTPKKQDKQFINSSTPKKQDKQFISSSTQKKQDKKFIDLSTQKKQDKKLTNSYTQKKQTKHFINSIYWKKYPLLNIYKLMKADPVPFIILFLLFIFYVYKRKGDSLE